MTTVKVVVVDDAGLALPNVDVSLGARKKDPLILGRDCSRDVRSDLSCDLNRDRSQVVT